MQCKDFWKKLSVFLVLISGMSQVFSDAAFDGKGRLVGKVTDENGNAVAGYALKLEKKDAVTDASGIFYFDDLNSGEYKLSGGKKGYTHYEEKVFFGDKRELYVIQVETIESFFLKVEEAVEAEDMEWALEMLEEERLFNGENLEFKYFESFINFFNFPTAENKKKVLKAAELLHKERR